MNQDVSKMYSFPSWQSDMLIVHEDARGEYFIERLPDEIQVGPGFAARCPLPGLVHTFAAGEWGEYLALTAANCHALYKHLHTEADGSEHYAYSYHVMKGRYS
jgi:hypothetical protein